jgi:hypothetical protein
VAPFFSALALQPVLTITQAVVVIKLPVMPRVMCSIPVGALFARGISVQVVVVGDASCRVPTAFGPTVCTSRIVEVITIGVPFHPASMCSSKGNAYTKISTCVFARSLYFGSRCFSQALHQKKLCKRTSAALRSVRHFKGSYWSL